MSEERRRRIRIREIMDPDELQKYRNRRKLPPILIAIYGILILSAILTQLETLMFFSMCCTLPMLFVTYYVFTTIHNFTHITEITDSELIFIKSKGNLINRKIHRHIIPFISISQMRKEDEAYAVMLDNCQRYYLPDTHKDRFKEIAEKIHMHITDDLSQDVPLHYAPPKIHTISSNDSIYNEEIRGNIRQSMGWIGPLSFVFAFAVFFESFIAFEVLSNMIFLHESPGTAFGGTSVGGTICGLFVAVTIPIFMIQLFKRIDASILRLKDDIHREMHKKFHIIVARRDNFDKISEGVSWGNLAKYAEPGSRISRYYALNSMFVALGFIMGLIILLFIFPMILIHAIMMRSPSMETIQGITAGIVIFLFFILLYKVTSSRIETMKEDLVLSLQRRYWWSEEQPEIAY